MRKHILIAAVLICLACYAGARGQILEIAKLNTDEIRALDRPRTVVILVGGILEQHGPHLPSFTDGYANEWMARSLAEEIVHKRPGTIVLMFPMIPLGHEGANEIGGKHVYPGTYSVRRSTLRAIFMDLGTELGEQGFKNVFIVHAHGSPFHALMLDQAGEYFRDAYSGQMVYLHGLMPTDEQKNKLGLGSLDLGITSTQKQEIGQMDEHAGFEETSRMLFLRPDLVSPIFKTLAPLITNNPQQFFAAARAANWPGYLSSPRLATAYYGAALQADRAGYNNRLALALLDRTLNERDIPRYSRFMISNEAILKELTLSEKNDRERTRKQEDWLRKNQIRNENTY
jgi:creatinine amidohydrolase/Fe(II)-dependent formamide hydrolase-like protein